jgi:hypothetical protein
VEVLTPEHQIGRLRGNRLQNGMLLQFSGKPDCAFLVQVSADLVNWETLGQATAPGPLSYEFEDTAVNASPWRFYRVLAQ